MGWDPKWRVTLLRANQLRGILAVICKNEFWVGRIKIKSYAARNRLGISSGDKDLQFKTRSPVEQSRKVVGVGERRVIKCCLLEQIVPMLQCPNRRTYCEEYLAALCPDATTPGPRLHARH